jgi:hypothetical protein
VQCGGADALAAEHAGVRMGGRDCTERAGAVVLLEPAEVSQETASGHAVCYQEGGGAELTRGSW